MAASLVATLAGVPLAWWLIKISNLRIPMIMAIVFALLGTLIILVLPETLHLKERQILPLDDSGQAPAEVVRDESSSLDGEGTPTFSKKNWLMLLEKFEESSFVFTDPKLLALSATFLVQSLHAVMTQFLLLLASKRLDWTIADVCTTYFSIPKYFMY